MIKATRLYGACLLGVTFLETTVGAQAAAQPAAAGAKSEAGSEIVVTAQRRDESAQDVPIAITVMSGDQLDARGIERISDLSMIAPSLHVDRTGLYHQPAIRGITSLVSGSTYENNVAVYMDGIYTPSGRALDMDFVSISQVEVLKGPQGTLFGRNATGGAIMIGTMDPSRTETSGRLSASYSRFKDWQAQGYFSTPISDRIAVNVAGSYRKSDGYIRDIAGFDTAPIKNFYVGAKLLIEPVDGLVITGIFNTFRNEDGRVLAITYAGRSSIVAANPGTYLETRDNRTSLNRPTENQIDQDTYAGKIEYDFGPAKLTSLTSWQKSRAHLQHDLDGTKIRAFEQDLKTKDRTFQQDTNIASTGEGPLQWVVGLYYFNWVDDQTSFNVITNARNSRTYLKAKSYAGYADATWEASPGLFLTGGIRYSHETKDFRAFSGAGAVLNTAPGQQKLTFKSWTPRAALRYEIDSDTSVYGSFSKGFKSGNISISAPFNRVAPEKVSAFELGFKAQRGAIRFDASTYYYDYKNLQVSSTNVLNNVSTIVTSNAASAEIYGAEAQVFAKWSAQLEMNAGVAYTHARYKKFPNASASGLTAAGLNTSFCPNPSAPPATIPCTQDWSGRQIARSPDWTFNIGANYALPTGIGDFDLSGNLAYKSAYIPTKGDLLNGRHRYRQGGYALLNLKATWTPAGQDVFSASVFGNNVTDTRYYYYLTGSVFGDYHVLGQPATWGVQVNARF